MKYIRTKGGKIYKALEDYMQSDLPPTKIRVEDVAKDWHIIISKNQVIKQADTFEELCDGFIFKDTHTNELHFLDINSGISLLGASLFVETLRGFIETDKGLIYVAKMNNKGDLELL